MNTEGTGATGVADDQQMVTVTERENFVGRLTQHFNGNRELASRFDDAAYSRSGGKLTLYRRVLQTLVQQRNQQIQNQQQQQQQSIVNSQGQQQIYMQPQQLQQQPQQTIINPQGQQQMYIQSQPTQMSGIAQQQQQQQQPLPPQPLYGMPVQQPMTSIVQQTSMMSVKQEPQAASANMQSRPSTQSLPIQQQQQQQIKQELMAPIIQQQQQQPSGLQIQQMRSQLPPPPQYIQQQQPVTAPPQPTATVASQQRSLAQHLQQVRQQSYINQQQPDSSNVSQLQQQPQMTNSSTVPQSSSGSQDEILQHILTSPNPPKPPPPPTSQNAVQARLRTMNRNGRNQTVSSNQASVPQQSSPMASGSDSMMATSVAGVPSPLAHPSIMQQQQQAQPPPVGAAGQSPLARYMMAQSPQGSIYRPQMSPMNMMNYSSSPIAMVDDELQFLFKFFNERIQYVTRIIARCQQEGQHDKVVKYRQLNDQMSLFVRNPIPEHIMAARRLKEHVDRILGPTTASSMNEMSAMIPAGASNTRLMTNGIFEQCQRTIVDYLSKDPTLKYNIAKRFLEPLNEVLNGVPHKNIRLDTDSRQVADSTLPSMPNHSGTSLTSTIEGELAHLTTNTFSYELKPIHEKIIVLPSTPKKSDAVIKDYELTCRLIEINMPVVPPLKMKLSIQYPNESPEILSLIPTKMNTTPSKLENSDGNTFFESVSRNFVYFLFKLPTQHTVTDILNIWRTAIQNALFSQNES